jgi:hypothetical protein
VTFVGVNMCQGVIDGIRLYSVYIVQLVVQLSFAVDEEFYMAFMRRPLVIR